MPYLSAASLVGILVGGMAGVATLLLARRRGLRRERRIYVVILVAMQMVYLVFVFLPPVAGSLAEGMTRESVVLALFTMIALVGFRRWVWLLPLGYLAHGAWDLRHLWTPEAYVPPYYAELCVGYDWLLLAYLIYRVPVWKRAAGAQA